MKDIDKWNNNLPLRPAPGAIVERDAHAITKVVRVAESDTAIVIHTLRTFNPTYVAEQNKQYKHHPLLDTDWAKPSKLTITHTKFLCVNGTLCGKMMVPEEAPGYEVYNRSASRRFEHRTEPPTCVLVFLPD